MPKYLSRKRLLEERMRLDVHGIHAAYGVVRMPTWARDYVRTGHAHGILVCSFRNLSHTQDCQTAEVAPTALIDQKGVTYLRDGRGS